MFYGKVRYAVSNHGRLKSFSDDTNQGKILKGSLTEGFLFLRYKRFENKKIKNYHHSIHKMVAELFISKDNDEQEHVLHLDFDKVNNPINN